MNLMRTNSNNLSGDAGLVTWRANDLKPLIDQTAKHRKMTRSEWLAKVVKEALEREALEIGSQYA